MDQTLPQPSPERLVGNPDDDYERDVVVRLTSSTIQRFRRAKQRDWGLTEDRLVDLALTLLEARAEGLAPLPPPVEPVRLRRL